MAKIRIKTKAERLLEEALEKLKGKPVSPGASLKKKKKVKK